MLDAPYNTEYVIKGHTKNETRKNSKIIIMDKQKLADGAMRINYTRLVSLKRCCFRWRWPNSSFKKSHM